MRLQRTSFLRLVGNSALENPADSNLAPVSSFNRSTRTHQPVTRIMGNILLREVLPVYRTGLIPAESPE